MPLENKSIKRNLDKAKKLTKRDLDDSQYIDDKQDITDNSTIMNALKIGAIIGAGVVAYKSGALKPIMQNSLKFVHKFAESSGAEVTANMSAIKKWANKSVTTAGIVTENQTNKAFSLFRRNPNMSKPYALYDALRNDIRAIGNNGNAVHVGETAKNIISQTSDDLSDLIKMISTTRAETKIAAKSLDNTDIIKRLKELENTLTNNSYFGGNKGSLAVKQAMGEHFRVTQTLSEEAKQASLKRLGYRNLTLGDIFELAKDAENGNRPVGFKIKEGIDLKKFNIDPDIKSNEFAESFSEKMFNYLSSPSLRQGPQAKSFFHEDAWKNLVIDANLLTNGLEGKQMDIINAIMPRQSVAMLYNSLKEDFKIPLVGFNPINVFSKFTPGIDSWLSNTSREMNINFQWISGKSLQPVITGTKNNTSVREWATEKFGEKFSETDLFVIGKNAFIHGEGESGLLKVAEHIKVNDIQNARKAYQMPFSVNMLRQSAGLSTERPGYGPGMDWDTFKELIPPEKQTRIRKAWYNITDKLDLFRTEPMLGSDFKGDFSQTTNVDEFFNKRIDNLVYKLNPYSWIDKYKDKEALTTALKTKSYAEAFGFDPDLKVITDSGRKIVPHASVITKDAYSIKSIIQAAQEHGFNSQEFSENAKGLFAQFGSGFNADGSIGSFFTEATSKTWGLFNALDQGLDQVGLGLSINAKRSVGSYMGNLMLKRALPAYMITKIPGMLEYFSEPFFTEIDRKKHEGNPDYDDSQYHNITQWAANHLVRPVDIAAHQFMDITGLTKLFKKAQEMTPGSDQINELPGIYHLGLGQTTAEREEYIENGYDPIRKGRYWAAGNTPFTGGKIDHWRPNLYRRINADVKFSGTKYGSRQEYYDNTWYPNPVNPLAPLNHFVLDRHHWDKKHYADRPYLVESGDALTQMPWFGPIFDALERPFQHKMHKEYWKGNKPIIRPEDEAPSPLLRYGYDPRLNIKPQKISQKTYSDIKTTFANISVKNRHNTAKNIMQAKYDKENLERINERIKIEHRKFSDMLAKEVYQSKTLIQKIDARDSENREVQYRELYVNGPGSYATQKAEVNTELSSSYLPYRDYDRYGTPLEVYTTPGGRIKIVDVPDNLNLYKVNEEIKHYSLNKIYGTNQRVNINDYSNPDNAIGNDSEEIDNYFKYSLGNTFEQFGDVAGLKGFMIQQFITGKANQSGAVIESSGYSYGMANDFWSQNWGGFGGQLSEISRRFIPQKSNKVEQINPVRNTMPSWMPGRNYFIDFLHGDPYTKVMNGEERLPGEGYERLNHIHTRLNIDLSQFGKSEEELVKHFLHQDEETTWSDIQESKAQGSNAIALSALEETGIRNRKRIRKVNKHIRKMGDEYYGSFTQMADSLTDYIQGTNRGHEGAKKIHGKIVDTHNDITGRYDAIVRDMSSPTGNANMMVRSVDEETFKRLKSKKQVQQLDYSQLNYQIWATSNGRNKGYVRYINAQNQKDIHEVEVMFNRRQLESDLQSLANARRTVNEALAKGTIGRGELYPLLDRFRVLADTAPYSQEYKDISAKLAHAKLSESEKEEARQIRERAKAQKQPLRVYDYKFSTAETQREKVHVKEILDNNTIITEEYGRNHAIKFAGIRVSESSSELYNPETREYKDKAGRKRTGQFSKYTKKEAAEKMLNKYIKSGSEIEIEYDADPSRKFSKDSTRSIRAVVHARNTNINKLLLDKELASEKENDDSPAGIRARYTSGEIAFGSAMEKLTHKGIAAIPFVGQKLMQVKSPYESYRDREVYGKDFQSWNHPIRDIFLPNMVDKPIGDKRMGGVFPIVMGAFLGSLFGKSGYGKLIGGLTGAAIPAIGKIFAKGDGERDWRPKRRREQEDINTYVDTLKYVKNMRLYNQYAEKALKENKFNVREYIKEKESEGEYNKQKQKELNDYKRRVKLDFKHHTSYNFDYGSPKYVKEGMSRKEVVSAINKEISEIQSKRKIEKIPENAIKAIAYKQEAEKTMYAYEPGKDLSQFMAALPKKDRQYFQHFVDAPTSEKDKILKIAPKYMRRALQFTWQQPVDSKESLEEYFRTHALPDENWVGWQEDTNMNDVKVKIVHNLKQDPGEFNIWAQDKQQADEVNIPIPRIHKTNNSILVQSRLRELLSKQGLEDIQFMNTMSSGTYGDSMDLMVEHDERNDVENKIKRMAV